ncbi:PREDICTED: uncharacterized protein LOC108758112 [Trachymyrmex cornetzi]|uniref:uncharacterized protein LOC108758112 n=1 Tax=Trachymyrmex cornetzi TaxID=471704 RepID=UPI00084F23BC|nr:PREDICTED: uncharacterized protein LOC108758112 [Trachymyrmex cornetzi]
MNMNVFDAKHFKINKLLLSIIGLWPYQTTFTRTLKTTFATVAVIVMCAPMVAIESIHIIYVFLFIFKHPNDLDHIIELLPTMSGAVSCGAKFASLIYHFEKFKDLFQQFRDDWTNVSKKAEQIFRNYMEVSWRFTSTYTVWMATFVIGFALLPLVNPLLDVVSPLNITRPKKFIYPAEMLVDHEKYYYILLTIMYYGYFMACVVTLAIDTIYFAFIEHACALFDILKYNGAWYETSNTAKKMLLMLIIRSQIISEIKVAKSFVMNLENFTVIMKASLTYCMVMLSMREE